MDDAYSCVAKSKLKLKVDTSMKKKKKKKSKDKDKEQEKYRKTLNESQEEERLKNSGATGASGSGGRKLTKAELAFKQQQEKMRNKHIMERASTTHKQRVEKFNEHLDSLTEHFDIPKVSWTK